MPPAADRTAPATRDLVQPLGDLVILKTVRLLPTRQHGARAAAAEIKALMRRTADDVIRIGQQLSHMKEKVLPHGSFLPWIEAEFEMTHKTATNFMNVAAKFGAKVEIVSPLVPTALYELASSSAEVQAEVERRIAAGEIISDRTA